ncbi:hypothetical protein BS329_30505 [Amycolatopsis coloradensis]|uniref:Uncharacterized protein n=1 Tax=Amycolatopsis coloradensis TaxID=76021 RepID=A0A1R0KKA7_9PSEU|nr:hypothetical protein [Amycolatopsis coloradensis]OLZ46557.1 hypothetical protein BS329_30505 [Amycolatopsis coloradensis]
MSHGFEVDISELHAISERLRGAGDMLNQQRNHLPPGPANAGISTESLSEAMVRVIARASAQLDDLEDLIGSLGHSRAWYESADARARGDVLRTLTGASSPPGLYPAPNDPERQLP